MESAKQAVEITTSSSTFQNSYNKDYPLVLINNINLSHYGNRNFYLKGIH
jgi:hypothetical protein